MKRAMTELLDDQRGAVMLTGLFFAFFLVGALWYVIGIGDAIVFRNRMQEAADSAAFSTAAIHAKGMNFISVCNIIMLIMCAVHIIAGVIQDATIALCLTTGYACLAVRPAVANFKSVSTAMKMGISATSYLASVGAIAVPFAATVRSYRLGGEYGNQGRVGDVHVIAIGPSTIPYAVGGLGLIGIPNPTGVPALRVPLGLPVRGEKYNELCKKVGKDMVGVIFSGLPGFVASFANRFIGDVAGSLLKFRYCNDIMSTSDSTLRETQEAFQAMDDELQRRADQEDNERRAAGGQPRTQPRDRVDSTSSGGVRRAGNGAQGWSAWFDPGFDRGWGDPGLLVTVNSAHNGTIAYQIWALTYDPSYLDTSERKVSIAGSIGRGGSPVAADSQQRPSGFGYFAQAEFYYDCGDRWRADTCDGGITDYNASFGINWRARLRRLDTPSMTQLFMQYVMRNSRSSLGDAITNGLRRIGPLDRLFRSGTFGAVGVDALSGMITDYVVVPLQVAGVDWWQRNYGREPGIPEASH